MSVDDLGFGNDNSLVQAVRERQQRRNERRRKLGISDEPKLALKANPWPAPLQRLPELALSYALCREYAESTTVWADQFSQDEQIRLWNHIDPQVSPEVIMALGEHASWVMYAQFPFRYALIHAGRPEHERSAYARRLAEASQRARAGEIVGHQLLDPRRAAEPRPPSENVPEPPRCLPLPRKYAKFLEAIVPIVKTGPAYITEAAACSDASQDVRRARRLERDLACPTWADFVSAVHSGRFSASP
jgi:hypothetical protein